MASINADAKSGPFPVRTSMVIKTDQKPSGKSADAPAPAAGPKPAHETGLDPITKEKTPMCLVNELARFNKLKHQYTLVDEQGPAHKKTFFVQLKLGDEEYNSMEGSIKRAQHLAAQQALQQSRYKKPPPKDLANLSPYEQAPQTNTITPTVELNALAMKRGEKADYVQSEAPRTNYCPPNYDYRGMMGPRRFPGHRPPRTFAVTLRVGNREFIGEGFCRQAARHAAADKALKVLRSLPIPQVEQNGEDCIENCADDLKSEISLVHEMALRRKMTIAFDVISESGPPHMRTFITQCTVGDMKTTGDGNSKRQSKKNSAELMLDEMKKLEPLPPAPPKNKPKNNGNKKKNRNLIKAQKAVPEYGQNINPISRLIQIQQAKKERDPVYSLLEEKGLPRRREFIMQIEVGTMTCTGTAQNKKLAKRAAAENMLTLMGFTRPTQQPEKPALKTTGIKSDQQIADQSKKVTFTNPEVVTPSGRQLVPGLIVMPDASRTDVTWANEMFGSGSRMAAGGDHAGLSNGNDDKGSPKSESVVSPKQQLLYLAGVLGFQVQFTDFPKNNNKNEYLSLVSLSTNPPHVSHGAGPTVEASHDAAALTALRSMSKVGLDQLNSVPGDGATKA